MTCFQSKWLGCMPYDQAHALQTATRDAVGRGEAPPTLLLLEHPPVVTLGRRGESDDLRDRQALADRQIPVIQSERGGQATYHGPGQLVGYLMARARDLAPDLPALVGGIEEAMIAVAGQLGVRARRDHDRSSQGQSPRTPRRGVWVGEEKLGFVGIAVTHGITWHGFALNLATDLSAFELIRPCGLDVAVTSIAAAGGLPITLPEAAGMMAGELARAFTLEAVAS